MADSLDAVVAEYLARRAAVDRHGSVVKYRGSLASFVGFLRRDFPALRRWREVRRAHALAWLCDLNAPARRLATSTRRHRIWDVRLFLARIAAEGVEDRPPEPLFLPGDWPQRDDLLPKALSAEQDEKLLKVLREHPSLEAKAVLLLRLTGMRVGELRTLERDCLSRLGDGLWTVRVPLGKLHHDRVVPADREIADLVAELLRRTAADADAARPAGPLLVGKGGVPFNRERISHALRRFAQQAGIAERVWPHRLRHTYATDLLRRGAHFVVVMRTLGHRSLAMTMRYIALTPTDLGAAFLKARANVAYRLQHDGGARPPGGTDDVGAVANDLRRLAARLARLASDHPHAAAKRRLRRARESLLRVKKNLDTD
jgi:integrase/recombinase XerD